MRGGNLTIPSSAGFLHSEEATKAAIKDGFFTTGDRAHADKDGSFFIAARPPRNDD